MNAPTPAQLVAARWLFRAAYLAFEDDDAAFWRTLSPGQQVSVACMLDELDRVRATAPHPGRTE